MNRRDTLAALIVLGIASRHAQAQPAGKLRRIGFLTPRSQPMPPARDAFFSGQGQTLASASLKNRIPAVSIYADHVSAGSLLSYGQNIADYHRRSASFVDKILKGAKPADLPVEQPTLIELVINLKTARGLGITIPQSLLLRADRVIE